MLVSIRIISLSLALNFCLSVALAGGESSGGGGHFIEIAFRSEFDKMAEALSHFNIRWVSGQPVYLQRINHALNNHKIKVELTDSQLQIGNSLVSAITTPYRNSCNQRRFQPPKEDLLTNASFTIQLYRPDWVLFYKDTPLLRKMVIHELTRVLGLCDDIAQRSVTWWFEKVLNAYEAYQKRSNGEIVQVGNVFTIRDTPEEPLFISSKSGTLNCEYDVGVICRPDIVYPYKEENMSSNVISVLGVGQRFLGLCYNRRVICEP